MISLNPFRKNFPWAPDKLKVVILQVMDKKTSKTNKLEKWFAREIRKEGHILVASRNVPKDFLSIGAALTDSVRENLADMILVCGGTSLSRSDITIEACHALFHREIPAFDAIFSTLLFKEKGSSALLDRASAGIIGESLVFCLPGDLKACRLACYDLIFPEARQMISSMRTPATTSPNQ